MANKYRIGVIGHTGRGNYGHGLDVVWRDVPDCEIVAVADADQQGRAAAVKRLGGPPGYADYRQMLDEAKPDIVSICPRWADQHHAMVLAAAERGMHIYLEKPMCRTLVEADAMAAACEQHDVKLAIAFQTRYSPKLHVVRAMIEDGAIGEMLEFRGRGGEDHRGGGEDLWELGSHIFNLVQYFGGEAEWCFATLLQDGRPVRRADVKPGNEGLGPLAGDRVDAVYGLADGVRAHFSSRRNAGVPGGERCVLQIFGTKGVLEMRTGFLPAVAYLEDPLWSPGRSGKQWISVSSAGPGTPEPLKDGGLHAGNVLACIDLLGAIEEDRLPEANVYEARTTVEMICAVFESHRVGGPVTLPLKIRKNPLTMLGSKNGKVE